MNACINASINLGLQVGGKGKEFIGMHIVKGCHAKGRMAYFGIEEKVGNGHLKHLVKPLYRPNGYDCGNLLILHVIGENRKF